MNWILSIIARAALIVKRERIRYKIVSNISVMINPLVVRAHAGEISIKLDMEFTGNHSMQLPVIISMGFLGNYVLSCFFLDTIKSQFAPWLFKLPASSEVQLSLQSKQKYLASIVSSLKDYRLAIGSSCIVGILIL